MMVSSSVPALEVDADESEGTGQGSVVLPQIPSDQSADVDALTLLRFSRRQKYLWILRRFKAWANSNVVIRDLADLTPLTDCPNAEELVTYALQNFSSLSGSSGDQGFH